jgi:hypothetical protein
MGDKYVLHAALLDAVNEINSLAGVPDHGIANENAPLLDLPGWSSEDIKFAFKDTGLSYRKKFGSTSIIIGKFTQAVAYRRTAQAERFVEVLRSWDFAAVVYYYY